MALPAELCGIICQDAQLDRKDLRSLCVISRVFRQEAERLLYSSVHLGTLRLIKSWCLALSRRPERALRVQTLCLTMPPSTSIDPADLSKITLALRACSNLRELEVQNNGITATGHSLQSWILLGHPFRLSKFVNSYFHSGRLLPFLTEQSDIRVLALRSLQGADLPDDILPNLSTLDVSAEVVLRIALSAWGRERPLQHLQFHSSHPSDVDELQYFVALSRFSQTLTSLSLCRFAGEGGVDVSIVFTCVATQLPELKYFRFIDETTVDRQSMVPILPFALRFNRIETIVLKTAKARHPVISDLTWSIFPEMHTENGRFETAQRIMILSPTLLRLVFITSKNYLFTKTVEGVVENGGTVDLDDSSWMYV